MLLCLSNSQFKPVFFAVALGIAASAQADYVSTAINRIFIDPASVPVLLNGFQKNDEVSFIFETTPEITSGATSGVGAWSTVYLPRGAQVIAADLVVASGSGYSTIIARDVATISSFEGPAAGTYGCGNRGCSITADAAGTTRSDDGGLGLNQQDTGVFFSTDSQTALLATPLSRDPTGSPVTNVHNTWDANQIDAFGIAGSLTGNSGRGTTPVVSYDSGATFFGTGSPVAGPDTYFSHDYDPSNCRVADGGAFTPPVEATATQGRLGCIGPWNRIAYPNAKIALATSTPVLVAVASTGTAPSNRVNNSLVTTAGTVLSSAAPLPANTNALRFVAGVRNVGDLELTRVTLRITNTDTDLANFISDLTGGTKFCLDATGGDNNTNARGGQDNIFRYYEGNNHACYKADPGILLKQTTFVNNVASSGNSLRPGDVIGYAISFTNTTAAAISNVALSDLITLPSPLRLVAASFAGCPYTTYNGDLGGAGIAPVFTGLTGTSPNFTGGTWATFNSPAGSTVTVHACAQVQAAAAVGDQAVNEARAVYATITSSSSANGTISGVDFGDAPNSYGTTGLSDGARHNTTFSTTLRLGTVGPDSESDGTGTGNAGNDDVVAAAATPIPAKVDDEDGISTPTTLNAGAASYGISVSGTNDLAVNGAVAGICSYLDIDMDGVFDNDAIEREFDSVPDNTVGGTFAQAFVPNQTMAEGTTYLRLRLSGQFGAEAQCLPTGAAANGEVEDYPVTVQSRDFGDLPDAAAGVSPSAGGAAPNYRTTLTDGGPRATVASGLRLGALNDADLDGANSLGVADDSTDSLDDEEGLESISPRVAGAPSQSPITANVRVTNATGAAARICLFVDRNADGTFDDQAEIGSVAVPTGTTNVLLPVVLPASGVITQPANTPGIGIRLRLALESDIGPTCEAAEADGQLTGSGAPAIGEVEDYYTGAAGTVPVTLSNVEVLESGGELVVNFNTATEAGTLGFRILADIGKGIQARVEIGSVASKTIDSLKEQAYSVRSRNPGADQIWIEESSVDGKSELYGPYKVGSSVGEVGLAAPLNWAAINAEQTSFRSDRAVLLRGSSAQAAELRVSADAWVRVTHEQLLAAGVDLSGQSSNNIAVRLGSETVPARVNLGAKSFGAGSTIEFFAKAVKNSLYTTTSVYRIEIGRSLGLAEIDARSTGLSVGHEVLAVADTLLLNKNTSYSFSSPLEDPWFNFRALRSGGAPVGVGSINFTLKDRVASFVERDKPSDTNLSTETIEVSFWGGLDYAGSTPDHHAVFKLNGVTLGSTKFDGFSARVERFAVPTGVLLDTMNTFTVELPTGTGYAADIVNVESVSVSYTRKLIPQTDRFSVLLPATPAANATKAAEGADKINASTFVISGLSGVPVVALLERDGAQSVLKTDAIAAGSLRIELAALAGDRLSLMPVESSPTPSAALALEDPIAGVDKASYLIISHPSFIANLTPLISAKQQQGFSVKVVDVEAIYRYYSAGVVDPAAIQLAIRRASRDLSTTHVLLVGGDTYDYQNVLGVNSVSFIPTNYRRTGPIIAFAPSDAVYADTDSNGVANLAIGRWPVRTNAELNALLGKTLSYQNTHKALFISDRSLNGISYANHAAPLANLLGQDWTSSQLSLDSYAAGQAATARADIVSNLEGGTSLLSYYGHSAPASWSREGLITASHVSGGLFNTVNQPFAAVQLGCWGTYFVEPTSTTVAHQMLLMPKGAAAVLGATSLTESNSDLALANHLLPRLSTTNLGNALLQAQQAVATELPQATDVILGGTLLGDPALK